MIFELINLLFNHFFNRFLSFHHMGWYNQCVFHLVFCYFYLKHFLHNLNRLYELSVNIDRLSAEVHLRGTFALELAPRRRGPLDNSEADRRNPTRTVQVDSDSTLKRRPMAFGTTGRLGPPPTPAAPPGDPRRAPLSPQSDGEAVPCLTKHWRARRHHRWQLDSDLSDALAHLARDWRAAKAPVVQRKPGEG